MITAVRCLPHLPSSTDDPFIEDGIYPNLLAPLRKEEKVWSECLFADPVGGLAVLGPPHGESLAAELRDYEALMKSVGTLQVGRVQGDTSALLMARDRGWFQCTIGYPGRGPLLVRDAAAPLKGSMFGSPIITDAGLAIGVVTSVEAEEQGGPVEQPVLADHLPGWLLCILGLAEARA